MKKLILASALALSVSMAWGQGGTVHTPPTINLSESRLTGCAGSEITLVAAAGCSFGASNSHTLTLPNTGDTMVWVCMQVVDVDGYTGSACIPVTILPTPVIPKFPVSLYKIIKKYGHCTISAIFIAGDSR
ncbi:MAG: hypothetical protein LBD91_05925 [Prevotellaceae bacterium]|nr:hypothetical protein [Prevotellaceae bacterium]